MKKGCQAPFFDKDDNLITRYEYTSDRVPETMTTENNETYHLLYNHQGSLRAVVDQEGTIIKELQYDSFGKITLDTNPDFEIEFGFAGGLYDKDTKLTRFGYRDYDAHTGKWTAKDPIGFQGGDTNLYGYVLQDPVGFVDPLGLNYCPVQDDYQNPIMKKALGDKRDHPVEQLKRNMDYRQISPLKRDYNTGKVYMPETNMTHHGPKG